MVGPHSAAGPGDTNRGLRPSALIASAGFQVPAGDSPSGKRFQGKKGERKMLRWTSTDSDPKLVQLFRAGVTSNGGLQISRNTLRL